MAGKIDLIKDKKTLYAPSSKAPLLVEVPAQSYLMLDGSGDPGSERYQAVVQTLYQLSYALKFMIKKQQGIDYGVMPLEGLWWAPEGQQFLMDARDQWQWTMMIGQPEWVTPALLQEAVPQVVKKGSLLAVEVRLETLNEGLSVQIMHLGPYDNEPPVIAAMHAFVAANGCQLRGKHHEIYLGDPRRTAPEKLKTVLRHPVQKAA